MNPTPSLLFPAALAVLAAASPIPLRAEPTLTLAGLPETVRAGESLAVEVEVAGAGPDSPVGVVAWVKGKRVFDLEKRLPGPARLTFALPVPLSAAGSTLAVQARCPGAVSEPTFLRVLPATGDEEVPGAKRARASGPAGAAASAPGLLGALPGPLKPRVAGFLHPKQHLAAVDKAWSLAAGEATTHLTISGDINDASLERLLARCSRLTAIRFMDTPDLSPKGILKALKPCTRLTTLNNQGTKLKFSHLLELARTHPRLVHLAFPPAEDIVDGELAQLPDRITALEVRSTTLRDETLARFPSLRTLKLTGSRVFKGDRLPAGLTLLDAMHCPAFAPEVLPEGLISLRVAGAEGFHGPIGLRQLECLCLQGCPGVTRDLLREAVKNARSLVTFQGDRVDAELIGALPEGVQYLNLHAGIDLADGVFSRFKGLKALELSFCPRLTGALLPAGLNELKAVHCANFRSEPLAGTPLEKLVVEHCPAFTGIGCPESLGILELSRCKATASENVFNGLESLPRLARLVLVGGPMLAWPAPGILEAHPALAFCAFTASDGTQRRWVRPQAPAAPPAGAPRP